MKLLSCILILLALSLTPVSAEIFYSDDLKGFELETPVVKKLEELLSKEDDSGMATIYINNVVLADADYDGDEDLLVSYSLNGIGGGNLSLMSIAYFARQSGVLTLKAELENGSTGTGEGRILVPTEFENGSYLCDTIEFAPEDGASNPTIQGKTRLVYESERLYEMPEKKK